MQEPKNVEDHWSNDSYKLLYRYQLKNNDLANVLHILQVKDLFKAKSGSLAS